jgi:hypothetical protein
VASREARLLLPEQQVPSGGKPLSVGGVLGDGLGALGDSVLGKLAGEDEADRGLDLAARQRLLGQVGSLARDAAVDVTDEGVHDRHGLLGDARVRVHLLQHLVDVDRVRLGAEEGSDP